MKKVSKILFLVGGILGIVLAVTYLVVNIVFFVCGGFATAYAAGSDVAPEVKEAIYDFVKTHIPGTYTEEAFWSAAAAYLFAQGALFVVMMLFSIASAIVSFILRKKDKTGLPLPIVLAVLSWAGNVAAFGGAVVAIVNWAVVERKEGQEPASEEPKQVEEKSE